MIPPRKRGYLQKIYPPGFAAVSMYVDNMISWTVSLFGEMWTLGSGVRRAVECFAGHTNKIVDNHGLGYDVNCGGPVQEFSKETYLVCGLETAVIF